MSNTTGDASTTDDSTSSTPSSTTPTSTTTTSTSTTPTSTSTTPSSTPASPTSTTPSSSSTPQSSSSEDVQTSTIVTTAPVSTITGQNGETSTVYQTITTGVSVAPGGGSGTSSSSSSGATGGLTGNSPSNSDGSLSTGGKIAIAVVVPIAGVALLVLAGIWFWRRRKQRKDAEEERRKEVEDYGYNPNADPTVPAVAGEAAAFETKDAPSGYRGWGSTTAADSTGRGPSTTMSGGAGDQYTDAPSSSGGYGEAARDGAHSPQGEILGAMGPSASQNRGGNAGLRRGPSNASSSYSAGNRSDGSGDGPIGTAHGGGGGGSPPRDPFYGADQGYTAFNPYAADADNGGAGAPQQAGGAAGSPVIRDVQARRNVRTENASHLPQTGGISQNF